MRTRLNRLSLWRTELIQLVALLAYVGVVEAIVAAAQPRLTGETLLLISLVLAVIPALLWMSMFYTQDRAEPEPRSFVLGVALLGALLAGAVGLPLLNSFFRVSDWIGRDPLTQVLGSILVVGSLQAFLKYVAIRFSIFYSAEFDQRIDGVIYGSAVGLGYATMLNIDFVVASGGVDLGTGVVRIVITQMVQGSLGALIGYFLGRDKFDTRRVWWMSAGLVLAAVIDGLFTWLSGTLSRSPIHLVSDGTISTGSAGYTPWPSLVLATILAAGLLGTIFILIGRDLRADSVSPTPVSQLQPEPVV
ncbi:MAG: PrsW family glutamic-type intramembrane protease [Chloroflexota bacterium]|nr:PrsW family glutamic-type intramembrane protease [Chloroflexota bacterium]